MEGPNAGTWVARLEQLSGLTAWHRRSRRPVLFSLFLYALMLAGATYSSLVTPEETALRGEHWFYASLASWGTAVTSSMVGSALCEGTLGRPRGRWGRTLRKVAALGVIPAGIFVLAAIGYMVLGATGAVVGVILSLPLQAASLLHGRRGRTPPDDEPGAHDPRDGGPA